jgi:hypothetical protein
MAPVSVPRVLSWGNPNYFLLEKYGLSPCHGGGPRAPLLFGRGVAGMADPTRPPAHPFPFFHHLVMGHDPDHPGFLVRPQLLTRVSFTSVRASPRLFDFLRQWCGDPRWCSLAKIWAMFRRGFSPA